MNMNISSRLDLELPTKSYIIFGYTPFCGTCKLAEKMVDVAAMTTHIDVIKIDLNYYPEFTKSLEIMSVPVIVLVHHDQVVEMIYKTESVSFLYEKFTKLLTLK